jgi:hypothetical protein
MNNKEGIYIINTNVSTTIMHVGLKEGGFNQGLRLILELNGRLLSNDLPELITQDPGVHFGKTIPLWKGNS